MANTPTYWDYLKLGDLLGLQGGLEDDPANMLPDELHFIVVHQVYEMWFKLVLRSLRLARNRLAEPRVSEETIPDVVSHLRRVSEIMQLGVAQFDVMETMTPQGFLAFREKLYPSSGFQSFQMREIEILMGLEDAARIRYGNEDPVQHIENAAKRSGDGEWVVERLNQARKEDSLLSVLNQWLYRTPIQGSQPGDKDDEQVVCKFIDGYLAQAKKGADQQLERMLEVLPAGDPKKVRERFAQVGEVTRGFLYALDIKEEDRAVIQRVRAAILFIESYRKLPLLAWPRLLLDMVVEMEEQLVMWRHRHVRMVERLIGRRVGTGGSSGVEYLDKTSSYRVFSDLWTVRTILLEESRLPGLENPLFYGFHTE